MKPESFEKPKERDIAVNTSSAASSENDAIDDGQKSQEQSNDPLLQESRLSNKEQRKADWAIIKEMSKYLWPKDNMGTKFRVGVSVGLLVGAKVCI